MSRFDYKNNTVIKRVETVRVVTSSYVDILANEELNRVQKVLAIREKVRDSYTHYREVSIKFVDGVIDEMIATGKQEGRPLPEVLYFEVEMSMPLVEASSVPVSLKYDRNYKDEIRNSIPPTWRKDNDHIYWE